MTSQHETGRKQPWTCARGVRPYLLLVTIFTAGELEGMRDCAWVLQEIVRDLEKRIAELEQALHEQIDQTMKMRDLRDRFDAESA